MDADRLHHREVTIGNRSVDTFEPEGLFGDDEIIDAFARRVRDLFARGRHDIRISCRRMTFLSARGLGALIRTFSLATLRGGRLVVDYRSNTRVRELFEITNLDGMFEAEGDDPDDWTAGKAAPLIPPPNPGSLGMAQEPDRSPDDSEG